MIFIIGFIISTVLLTYTLFFIYFIVKKKKFYLLLFILFSTFIASFFYKFKPYDNCPDWAKGINNTIDNDSKDYPCKIQIPKKCVLDRLGNIVDIPRYIKTECHLSGVIKN